MIAVRCVDVQFQALAVSTAACGVLGVAGFVALHAGLPVRSESRVASWQDAVALARRERVSPHSHWMCWTSGLQNAVWRQHV